jgi:hypothetical protein
VKVFASFFKKKRFLAFARVSGSFLKKEPKNFHPLCRGSKCGFSNQWRG